MNLPNRLTVSRFALTAVFMAVMFGRFPGHETIGLLVFLAGAVTDILDGRIARGRGLITNFGILMDPLADKVLVCAAFVVFVERGLMPAWMVVIIVSRELAITGLRLLAASQNVVLAAERYGKHKTFSQIVAIVATLLVAGLPHWVGPARAVFEAPIAGHPWTDWFATFSRWAAVLLTFTSGGLYLWRNRELFLKDA
jgi:CDP-diacylglycerol---glycerol-3-phosphate 3-phosphatidyltransferase